MTRDERDPAAGESPLGEANAAEDSATPGKKPIDDTAESNPERREHPGHAELEKEEDER